MNKSDNDKIRKTVIFIHNGARVVLEMTGTNAECIEFVKHCYEGARDIDIKYK